MSAKIQNCRTLLRRNWKREESSNPVLVDLKSDSRRALRADALPELLRVEGTAGARYLRSFAAMLNESESDEEFSFDFATRNRRPPKDPVNALLSFAYSPAARERALQCRHGTVQCSTALAGSARRGSLRRIPRGTFAASLKLRGSTACNVHKARIPRGTPQREHKDSDRYKVVNFIGVTVCNSIPRETHREPARVRPSVPWSP